MENFKLRPSDAPKRLQKKQKTKEKHKAILEGPAVAELLPFCEEPKAFKEIISFMIGYVKISHFVKVHIYLPKKWVSKR